MKHMNKHHSLMQTVAKTAAVTGVSLSMIAGNYAAIPHVALADDAPRSPFSEYAELVQKFSTLKLEQQDRNRLSNEIADAKKAYQESIKSPFRKYADAVQEYANTGKLAGQQLTEVRNLVKETKNAWIAEKNGQQNVGINNVPAAQDPADNNKAADNKGAAVDDNANVMPAPNNPVVDNAQAADVEDRAVADSNAEAGKVADDNAVGNKVEDAKVEGNNAEVVGETPQVEGDKSKADAQAQVKANRQIS